MSSTISAINAHTMINKFEVPDMIINELLNEDIQIGDSIDLEFGDLLVESVVEDLTDDGIVVKLDETALQLILSEKQKLNESKAGLKMANALKREREKIDREYKAGEEQRAKNKKEAEDKNKKVNEAEYQGRKVQLGKPMAGDVKKSKVYVKGPKGNVVKVNFGDKNMKIKKSNPKRRKSFRARHNCANPGPRWKARYWSCRAW